MLSLYNVSIYNGYDSVYIWALICVLAMWRYISFTFTFTLIVDENVLCVLCSIWRPHLITLFKQNFLSVYVCCAVCLDTFCHCLTVYDQQLNDDHDNSSDFLSRRSSDILISLTCYIIRRRSRQREQLSASMLSICSSVCLSVYRQNAKTRFSQKLSNLELRCLLTTYRKSYMGFSKNPILDP